MNYYAVERTGSSDTLEHFGVLGMRWGVRHDRRVRMAKARFKTDRKAINRDKSLSKTQKTRKIAASREQWMKEREKAANRLYSLNGKEMNRRIARQSSKKTVAKAMLLGSTGSAMYDNMRAKGHGRVLSGVVGGTVGRVDGQLLNLPSLGYYVANRARRPKKKK